MLLTKGVQHNSIILTQIKANIRALSSMHTSLKDEKIKAKYDIIVAGGGMVGCTMACALGIYNFILFFQIHRHSNYLSHFGANL